MNLTSTDIIGRNIPSVSHAEPVLAVNDVALSVNYWKEVLGFTNGWTLGNPPNHGGVSWNGGGFIQFGLNPEAAANINGHSVWIRVRNIELMYKLHVTNKANVTSQIDVKPWGFAEYTIVDVNGYAIHFSEPASDRGFKSEEMPPSIDVVSRKPSQEEVNLLLASVGWVTTDTDPLLDRCVTGVTAIESISGQAVGCALVFGDNAGFYYIKNLIVDPQWQGKRIATAIMKSLMIWFKANAQDGATVGLFTGDHLANFYRQFGFMQCCGMYTQILTGN